MARTDTLPHFLTDVADAIRTKTGSSATITASNFDTAISNISGGSPQQPQIEGSAIFIKEASGTTSSYFTTITNNTSSIKNDAFRYASPKKGLCIGYTRGDYSYSGTDITFIGDTEKIMFETANQSLVAIWSDNISNTTTLTQSMTNRMGFVTIMLKNAKKPTGLILSQVLDTPQSSITVNPTKNLCIYVVTTVYAMTTYFGSSVANDFAYIYNTDRLAVYISDNDKSKTIPLLSNSGCAIIGIEVEYDDGE